MLRQVCKSRCAQRRRILPAVLMNGMAALLMFLCILLAFGGPAWSFEAVTADRSGVSALASGNDAALTSSRPDVAEDPCLPLLRTARYNDSAPSSSASSVTYRGIRDDAAGQAAALGLVLGVRFVIGPKETAGSGNSRKSVRFDIWQPGDHNGNPHALAIADYRDCRKDEALRALSDWRWSR